MIGALVLGEELSLVHYLGIAVVMASIVMISGGAACWLCEGEENGK